MSYNKINFENKPSKKTPINATNLNHMEDGIQLAVGRSRHVIDELESGHLNGHDGLDGKDGKDGERGQQGPIGPIGPAGLVWRGAYSDTVSYVKDDAVGYEGASYFCVKPNKGIKPLPSNDSWALLAAMGARGERGENGINGKNGSNGLQGKDGVNGLNGKDGSNGVRGRDGNDGVNGKDGANGLAGKDGERGPEGPRGPRGFTGANGENGYIDVDNITDEQLSELYNKINKFNSIQNWYYSAVLKQSVTVPIADLNLEARIYLPSDYFDATINIEFLPRDFFKPAIFSMIASAATITGNPTSTNHSFFGSEPSNGPTELSGGALLIENIRISSGSITHVDILDGESGYWYEMRVFGNSDTREMYVNIHKTATQGRINIV